MLLQSSRKALITSLLLFLFVHSYSQWNVIYTSTMTPGFSPNQIDYTKDSAIFVSTAKNFFYSKNNGASFTPTNSFVITPGLWNFNNSSFSDISFSTKDTGVIGGETYSFPSYSALALSSTGSFTNWVHDSSLSINISSAKINSIKHFDNKIIYAFDNKTNIFYSSDNGHSWILKKQIENSPNKFGFSMCMVDEQQGYFATKHGLYKTIDGGQTMIQLNSIPAAYLNYVKKSGSEM